jgi:hypothetical protein
MNNCDDLIGTLYDYVLTKVINDEELTDVEEKVYLLVSMLLDSEMEGFVDLFYQFYSLRECAIVEETLRSLGLIKLAKLFRKAKDIYMYANDHISSDDDFHALYLQLTDEQRRQIDEIGDEILAQDSEIYQIGDKLCQYVKDNNRC